MKPELPRVAEYYRWIMLVNREVAFMTSISVFPKKYSRSFAIELARQLL